MSSLDPVPFWVYANGRNKGGDRWEINGEDYQIIREGNSIKIVPVKRKGLLRTIIEKIKEILLI